MEQRRRRRDRDEEEEEDDVELPMEELPEMDTSLDNVIAVYGIPVVAEKKKKDRLMKVIREKFSVAEGGEVVMPEDESGNLKGYCFIEYPTVEEASAAIAAMHNYDLDQNHRFKVYAFSQFASLDEGTVEDEYTPPTEKEIRDHVPTPTADNLKYWVSDKLGREQFAIKYHDESAVCWHDERERPSPIQTRVMWTEFFLQWSPKGSLLTTLHAQGVATWGGPECRKIMRFEHAGVRFIDFSPNETYLVTCAPNPVSRGGSLQNVVMIWEVRTGRLVRGFDPPQKAEELASQWPVFQWSHDDKYLAILSGDNETIRVYETPSFKLIDGRKLQISNVRNFEWSPTDNIIAAWVPEITTANKPARVVLIELPSRKEIRQQNLFSVSDCKMYWQKRGDFLCVKVDRTTKSGKTTFTNFELFRLRERGIPIEVVEFKDTVAAFEWEPCNAHFAILHTDAPGQGRLDVSFYTMAAPKVKFIKKLEKRACTGLYWSPRGTHAILGAVGLSTAGGALEFISVDPKDDTIEVLETQEHFMISNLEWDPTGRYVATFVSAWKYQMENGYRLWTFYGRLLHENKQDRFFQFQWRPRPEIQLSKEQEKTLTKDLYKKSKDYERIDYAREHTMDAAHTQRRRAMRDAFDSVVVQRTKEFKALHAAARRSARTNDEEEWSTIRMMTEEVLEEVREVIPREHTGDTDND